MALYGVEEMFDGSMCGADRLFLSNCFVGICTGPECHGTVIFLCMENASDKTISKLRTWNDLHSQIFHYANANFDTLITNTDEKENYTQKFYRFLDCTTKFWY